MADFFLRSQVLDEALAETTACLQESHVDCPRLSAEILMAHAMQMQREDFLKRLLLEPKVSLEADIATKISSFVARRALGEPVAYITGKKEFYGRDFSVNRATLIPRPETELLVDMALRFIKRTTLRNHGIFADFGTGSGCIAVTLALELPDWSGIALEISNDALAIAQKNAKKYEVSNLCCFQGDFTSPPFSDGCLDILVSNPPYVSDAEYAGLDHGVRSFEPKGALVPHLEQSAASASGLEALIRIVRQAERLLRPGGLLLMEIGCKQGAAILSELASHGWSNAAVHRDYAGLNRVISAEKQRI